MKFGYIDDIGTRISVKSNFRIEEYIIICLNIIKKTLISIGFNRGF